MLAPAAGSGERIGELMKIPKGVRKRADGRYEWRFQYNGESFSGYATSIRDAKEQLDNMKHDVKNGIFSKETQLTLDAWFEKWIEIYKTADCKESTLQFYRDTYKRYIKPVFGSKKIKSLNAEQIQLYSNQKAKEYSKSIASTINFLLFDCLRQAERLKLINKNPMVNTTPPKYKRTEKKKALSSDTVQLFLEYSKDSSYYPIFRTATLSGMRIGEILGLSWDCVDFDNECIRIEQQLCYTVEKGQYLDTPKSEASRRTIPMERDSELYRLMRKRRAEQNRQKLDMGTLWQTKAGMSNLVFTTRTGKPHSDSNIRKMIKFFISQMREDGHEIEDFTPHTLRHCFATRAIEAGMNPRTLQAILGHSTFEMTMNIYVDVMEKMKIEEMRKIQAAL